MITYSYETIETICKKIRLDNSKVVFTNGCFDLIHLGHLEILKTAASYGRVIVGMNSDDSVRRLKGDSRPINNEHVRSTILDSLSFVNYVVVFDETIPKQLIKAVNPNIIIKGGGEYTKEQLYDMTSLMAQHPEIYQITKIPNLSTSKLIEKIKLL